MTHAEIRALLARCDPRALRAGAGISIRTVARALSLPPKYIYRWEAREHVPDSPAGMRWLRFIAGLERHAAVSAEMAATEDEAA
jgi:DNA-binding transcriptional regulator YiaG